MKRIGIRGIQSIKFKYTTNSRHNLPIAPNLLEQNFKVTAPNTAWVGDITYIRVKQQWLYLATQGDWLGIWRAYQCQIGL